MVRVPGLEPGRSYDQRVLSPLRLPIPPYPHDISIADLAKLYKTFGKIVQCVYLSCLLLKERQAWLLLTLILYEAV